MSQVRASIVIETITVREHGARESVADQIAGAMNGVDRQSYPQELIERIIVVDDKIAPCEQELLRERYPGVRLVTSRSSNYFDAKNCGAAASSGEVVVLLDGDCVADRDWLMALLGRLKPGITAVTGKTRYARSSLTARIFSVTDFANVLAAPEGDATGIMLNNVAFVRQAILETPLDVRIPRNGGCYVLFHQLRAKGARIVYEPQAVVSHNPDVEHWGFVRKHFDRGYDGFVVYQLDDRRLFRGSPWVQRFGRMALIPLALRRTLLDWVRLARHRDQTGISSVSLPWFFIVAATVRMIELAGGLTARIRRTPGLAPKTAPLGEGGQATSR
jgi:glycosyltransferase involved in cell wall biosynthesis